MRHPRYIDAQGRIIIPAHIRKSLNLTEGKMLDIELREDGTIEVKPTEQRCIICGEPLTGKVYTEIHDKLVCLDCQDIIKERRR